MGMLDILGPVGNLLGGYLDNEAASDRQDAAQAFSERQFATRYQISVADLKAAGLNPMLAYGSGGSGPSAPQGTTSSPGSSFSGLGNKLIDALNTSADTANKLATKPLIDAQTVTQVNTAGNLAAQTRNYEATAEKVRQETQKLKGETNFDAQQRILQNTAKLIMENATIAQSEGSNRAQLIDQTIKKLANDNALSGLDIQAAKTMGNFGRTAGELGPVIQLIVQALRGRR